MMWYWHCIVQSNWSKTWYVLYKILNKHVESLNQDVIYIQVHIKEIIWNAFCCDAGKAMCWQNWIYQKTWLLKKKKKEPNMYITFKIFVHLISIFSEWCKLYNYVWYNLKYYFCIKHLWLANSVKAHKKISLLILYLKL